MTTITATITDNKVSLEKYADAINNGRTDGVYFYVNGNNVTVSHPHNQLSEDWQKSEIAWFLKGRAYNFS